MVPAVLPTPISASQIPSISQTPIASGGNISGAYEPKYGDVAVGGLASVGGIPQIFVIGIGVLGVCVLLKVFKRKST